LVKNLVKLAKLEKENFLVVVNFKFPILGHARGKLLPLVLGNVKRAGVVLRIIWSSASFILQVFLF
jgi:hypothetical protein